MEILFQYKHKCVSGAIRRTSKAECEKCNPPKPEPCPKTIIEALTIIADKMVAATATTLMLMALGCSVIDAGPRSDKKNNANTSNTTFVYSYNNAGAPVAGARVRDNVKITVQVKDPTTGTYYDRQMDAGGWLLVKPESPLEAAPTK